MPTIDIVIDPDRVDEYLSRHKLESGSVPIEAILLQRWGTEGGRPAVMIVFRDEQGRRVLAKTTLRLLKGAIQAIEAVTTPGHA